eukprot:6088289-Pyramimonas_sp.AAC.1
MQAPKGTTRGAQRSPIPDLRPTQELMERRWPVQTARGLLPRAPYWRPSSAQALPGLIRCDPNLRSARLEIYADATVGGYRHNGQACGPAWAPCIMAVS